MALDVPELVVTAEFFPHEWIWEILPVSAACVKCSTGHIMLIKGVCEIHRNVQMLYSSIAVDRITCESTARIHRESSPGLKPSSSHICIVFKYILINF
ncbi:hypothetical protein PO909_018820 [Leuciscus waleckii]